MMVLRFLLLWLGLEGAHASGAVSQMELADKVGSECALSTRTFERKASDVSEESQSEAIPRFFLDRNVYIVSAATPSEYLSVLQPDKQGDPGVFQRCESSKKPGCMWEIKPTADGKYYLKTSETDQTFHWTHGIQGDNARGEAATLYPCMGQDYSNCKWRFVKLPNDQNEYLIQAAREDNYLIAPAPADGKTMATVDVCSASKPDPKCVWKVGLDTSVVQPKWLEARNLYIESAGTPGEYLSVLRPDKQGDPGVWQKCRSGEAMTGCQWQLKETKDGQYYLKPSDSDMTLHWTWGAKEDTQGEAATLFPCMTEDSDASNCKWSFVSLNKNEYLLKAFDKEAYLIAPAPEKGDTMATIDSCSSFSPGPRCVWRVQSVNLALSPL